MQTRHGRQAITNKISLNGSTSQHQSLTDDRNLVAQKSLEYTAGDSGQSSGKCLSDTTRLTNDSSQASKDSNGRNRDSHGANSLRQHNTRQKDIVKAKVLANHRAKNSVYSGIAQKEKLPGGKGQLGSATRNQDTPGNNSSDNSGRQEADSQASKTFNTTNVMPASTSNSYADSSALRQGQPPMTETSDQARRYAKKRKAVEDQTPTQQKESLPQKEPRRRTQSKKPREAQQDESSQSAQVASHGKRRRQLTPDDAEAREIQPSITKMSEMTKDSGLGQKSRRDVLLSQVDWAAVKEREEQDREKERREERDASERKSRRNKRKQTDVHEETNGGQVNDGPRLRILNNELVLDETSQFIDEYAQTLEVAEEGGGALNESNLTKRVNQATIKPRRRKSRAIVWDEDNTEKFYEGLSMFGIDLKMIASHFFDGLDRQHLKRKYTKEERANPHKMQAALSGPRKSIAKDEMLAMEKYDYEDPKDIYARIEEKVKELEKAQAEEGEEETNCQDDHPNKRSKPRGSGRKESAAHNNETPAAEEDEHEGEARQTAEDATTGRKKPRKSTAPRKKAQRHKSVGGGTEEVLGSIEDVQL